MLKRCWGVALFGSNRYLITRLVATDVIERALDQGLPS